MFRLARFLKGYLKELIIGPLFKFTEAVFELIVPLVMAAIIDNGVKNNDAAYVYKMGAVLIILGLTGLTCALICQYLASVASQGTGTIIRNELYKHINSLSHAELDKLGAHSVIVRLTGDVNQIQLAVAMLIRLVVRAPFLAVGAVIMTIIIDIQLSLVILCVTPIIVLVIYLIMKHLTPFYKLIQSKLERITLIVRENLAGARVIRAFSNQEKEQKRFDEAGNDLAATAVKVGRLSALLNPLTAVIMNSGIILILRFGGFRVEAGNLSQGQLIAFVNYMTQIMLACIVVADVVIIFTKASASAARINEIFGTKSSIISGSVTEFANRAIAVKFNDVAFAYNEKPILENINLEIKKGETFGVIGATGSGKSTLVNLIPRFYDVSSGSIEIFGVDIRNIDLETLRKAVHIVPQQANVISGTVAGNIRWGNESATDDEIDEALRIGQAVGINSIIEQNGKNLSGGQKQRLTIARAIVGKPDILILDDSTSALDASTDLNLRKAIAENLKDTAVIIVSQRAGTLRRADKIAVMDNGEIVGLDTHFNLYDNCTLYREICESQAVSRGGES